MKTKLRVLFLFCLFALPVAAQRNAELIMTVPVLASPQVTAHSATLSWTAASSCGTDLTGTVPATCIGYNVARSTVPGGEVGMAPVVVTGTTFTDTSVVAGQTYYYEVATMNSASLTSVWSNEVQAVIPSGVTSLCTSIAVNCWIKTNGQANIRATAVNNGFGTLYGVEPAGAIGQVLQVSTAIIPGCGASCVWVKVKFNTCVAAIPNCTGWMGSDNMTVIPTPIPVVSITITPTIAALQVGQMQTFTAAVTGSADSSYTWSTNAPGGMFVATAPGTFTVTATSNADTSKSASATVTVQPQALSIVCPVASTGVSFLTSGAAYSMTVTQGTRTASCTGTAP